jgi:hypothetical protein
MKSNMEHFKHKRCNALLSGSNHKNVADLHIQRHEPPGYPGVTCVTSFWRPSEQDLANLLAGGSLAITVFGVTQPPMLVEALAN